MNSHAKRIPVDSEGKRFTFLFTLPFPFLLHTPYGHKVTRLKTATGRIKRTSSPSVSFLFYILFRAAPRAALIHAHHFPPSMCLLKIGAFLFKLPPHISHPPRLLYQTLIYNWKARGVRHWYGPMQYKLLGHHKYPSLSGHTYSWRHYRRMIHGTAKRFCALASVSPVITTVFRRGRVCAREKTLYHFLLV